MAFMRLQFDSGKSAEGSARHEDIGALLAVISLLEV